MKNPDRQVSGTDIKLSSIPELEPARSMLSDILKSIPTSTWIYARIDPHGRTLTPCGSRSPNDIQHLTGELKLQRLRHATGPSIGHAALPLENDGNAVTLIFADAYSDYAILEIYRNLILGAFTSSEIHLLTFALHAISDRLAAHRLQPNLEPEKADHTHANTRLDQPPSPTLFVLNTDFHIIAADSRPIHLATAGDGRGDGLAQSRLPAIVEESIRSLTAGWSLNSVNSAGTAYPLSFLEVHTTPMIGPDELFIGVTICRVKSKNSLIESASKYHISPRETQVLVLILNGSTLDQIAAQLCITSSTVQDHMKSMIEKTKSVNRSELIARLLGWESRPAMSTAG